MTRTEFSNALEDALQKAQRARAYTDGRFEIVLIATRDVYRFFTEQAGFTLNNLDNIERRGYQGMYNGFRIGIVNEQGYSDMLKPAMLGMEYYNGMETNDIIVVGDENRLFQLESREPICFRDMGLTASFENDAMETANATVTNTVANAIDETNAAVTATAATVNAARPVEMNYRDGRLFIDGIPIDLQHMVLEMEDLAGTTAQLNWDTIGHAAVAHVAATEPTRQVRTHRLARHKAPRAEEPLNPGDTKMLDEFLGSFAIKETLQHA